MNMKKIILIRHGESKANLNQNIHFEEGIFDNNIELTEKGISQAIECGKKLNQGFKPKTKVSVFHSSYRRAVQTCETIVSQLDQLKVTNITEDGRLREQEFKDFENKEDRLAKKERAKMRGKLYYRYKNGESGFDVLTRVGSFYNQLRMDLLLNNREDVIVIVAHEVVIRCFLGIALDLPTKDFAEMHIANCENITLVADNKLKFSRVNKTD
jgi:2,3-bisphosphoglycerate-dependent phosphoglycerate mutase